MAREIAAEAAPTVVAFGTECPFGLDGGVVAVVYRGWKPRLRGPTGNRAGRVVMTPI